MRRARTRLAIAAVLGTFASAVTATLASADSQAAEALVRVRGVILGKTFESIDVQIGTGLARMDQRFELHQDARIYVASRVRRDAVRVGAAVGVVFARGSRMRVRTLVVYPRDASNRPDRAVARDVAVGGDAPVDGVAVAPLVVEVGRAGTSRRVKVAPNAVVETLERGGVADLTTDSAVTITASAPGSSAEDVLRSAIVARAGAALPI